ncbi:hypothetical protein RR48_01313 [Papilio machaon]|uniref:Uncharacterized protein n=1 Tax=Papilio machaon TaxID=76193 RepID=A0A0N1IHP9_PAPMA|nr:hypothetical protein RR48_01313 [Papilio machaon]
MDSLIKKAERRKADEENLDLINLKDKKKVTKRAKVEKTINEENETKLGKHEKKALSKVFGLDKNCTYPYLRTVKTEPKTGRDGMVRIEDEIKDVFYEADYIHWDSDTSSDGEDEPYIKKRKVPNLSTLSLKTIFSPRYLGRVRRKRRKVKTEIIPENLTQNKDMFDVVDSFDDVHDLERLNDCSFDQLFGSALQKIVPDVEDNPMEEGSGHKEDNNLKEDSNGDIFSKEGKGDKDVNLSKEEHNSDKEVSLKKEENGIDKENSLNKEENGSDKDDSLSKEENSSNKDVSNQKQDNNINKEENRNNKQDDRLIEEENSSKKENSSLNEAVNGNNEDESIKDLNAKDKDERELTERLDESNIEGINKTNSLSKDTKYISEDKKDQKVISQDNLITNNQIEISNNTNILNSPVKDLNKSNVISQVDKIEDLPEINSKMETEEIIQKTDTQNVEKPKDINNFNQVKHNILCDSDFVNNKSIDPSNEEIVKTDKNEIKTKIESILEDTEKPKSPEISKETIISYKEIPTEIKDEELTDFLTNKEDELITENDLLGERNLNYTELSRDSTEFDGKDINLDENIDKKDINTFNKDTEINNLNIQKDKTEIKADKKDKSENMAEDIMKDILNKVRENTEEYLVNGEKNSEENTLDDQRLMDELDAQIGENIMEKHMDLDDFIVIINASLGNYYQNQEHLNIKENLQLFMQQFYPIDIVVDDNVGDILRETSKKTNKTSRFFSYFFGTTTTPTTTRDPRISGFLYELKSILETLDRVGEKLSHVIRFISSINRNFLPRSLKIRIRDRVKRENTDKISEVQSNVTDKINIQLKNMTEINGRRMHLSNSNLIKAELLNYLEESFNDIEENVESLKRFKQLLFINVPYKVGYILTNLAVNLRNLKETIRRNEKLWSKEEILNVYDRLKAIQSVITNLLNTSRMYINKEIKK